MEEGLRLALHWTQLGLTVETDCAEVAELIRETTPNTSVFAFKVNVIRDLLRERDTRIVKISRVINTAGHELAKLARVQGRTEFWLRSFPEEVAATISIECNLCSN
jgi:hypothetical protein